MSDSSEVEGNKAWWRRDRGWFWGEVDPREHGSSGEEEELVDPAPLGLSVGWRQRFVLLSRNNANLLTLTRRELELKDPFKKI